MNSLDPHSSDTITDDQKPEPSVMPSDVILEKNERPPLPLKALPDDSKSSSQLRFGLSTYLPALFFILVATFLPILDAVKITAIIGPAFLTTWISGFFLFNTKPAFYSTSFIVSALFFLGSLSATFFISYSGYHHWILLTALEQHKVFDQISWIGFFAFIAALFFAPLFFVKK